MTKSQKNSERDLVWIVQASSALSLGTLAAMLYSVRTVSPSIQFQVSLATPLAFILAAAGSLAFWSVVFALYRDEVKIETSPTPSSQRGRQVWLGVLAGMLGLGLLFAFIYPLKDFSHDKQSEISFGAVIALVFLSVLALLFWRVVHYLEHF